MKILKLKGRSEEAVLKQIEKEYGDRAVVVNSQKEKATGPLKWLKSSKQAVTIAIKEESDELEQRLPEEEALPAVDEMNSQMEYTSHELLVELKNDIEKIHKELSDLKQESYKFVNQTAAAGEAVPVNQVEASEEIKNRFVSYLNSKLINLGLKPEICQELVSRLETEKSENFIRALFSELETMMIQKESEELPQIIFFIGPTGVGKTTTLAKLTAKYVLEEQKKVVLFTSDTYRIAAVEQLKTYADILSVQIEIIYDESEIPKYIEKWKHMDHILIDTAGRSHKNAIQVTELKGLMQCIEEKQVFLVLNANTASKDVKKIVQTYEKAEKEFDLIITKLDETDEVGNIVNIGYYSQKPIMYLTNGQNVPTDIEVFNKQNYMTELFGRLNDE